MAAYQPHFYDFIIVCISWNNKKCFDTIDARCKHADVGGLSYIYKTFVFLLLCACWNTYRSFATTVPQLKICDFSGENFKCFEVL
jgi:hypothetical protein